jgi:hypothetical protein
VAVELNDIFARGARRGVKSKHQSVIEELAAVRAPKLA